ncbi:hypothetical protein HMPREF3219_0201892 [Streptococcus salivarius]|nr:hypothetical protein HMPREF3219_0201892 [Streptococcus salivarius]
MFIFEHEWKAWKIDNLPNFQSLSDRTPDYLIKKKGWVAWV